MSRPVALTAAALSAAALALASPGASPASAQSVAPAETAAPAAPVLSPTLAKLRQIETFTPALGARLTARNVARLSTRDLVVVDGEDASAAQVKRLKRRGAIVLGYLSVGTVESWRSWFSQLKPHRLAPLGDWEGERYTDLSAPAARDALADTIAPDLLAKGFDGLFLDSLDVVEEYPAQAAGALDVVTRLSKRVRDGGGVLMAQNADTVIDPFVPFLDAWNREDPTGTYDFGAKRYLPTDVPGRRLARATVRRLISSGLVVTTTDYYRSPTEHDAKRAVRISCKAGSVPFVGEITLSKVPAKPQRCPAA